MENNMEDVKSDLCVKLMKLESLDRTTTLYRYTSKNHLSRTADDRYELSANEGATEIIEDIYGSGHLIMAKNVGAGLAFTLEKEDEYGGESKVCVCVQLSDIIDQGGLIYQDRSSHIGKSYFLTMPEGKVEVTINS
jgi:hypothetical protein